jgi:quinolinate synthase
LYEVPEIQMEESLRLAAKLPMDRMMEISRKAGLVG